MKVILLQDVAKIGTRGSIVEVPDGFAQNKLIPKRLAQPATPANLKRAEQNQANVAAKQSEQEEHFKASAAKLKEADIKITADANEQGHMFKAVSEKEIAEAAKEAGVEIDAGMIKVSAPIKSVGEHEVALQLKDKTESFKIEVVAK